jgi:hypothetical protein
MKKLLGMIVLGLLLSGNAYAEKDHAHKKHGMNEKIINLYKSINN